MIIMAASRLLGIAPAIFNSRMNKAFNVLPRIAHAFHSSPCGTKEENMMSKRPLAPFFRFIRKVESAVSKQYPNIKRKELLRRISVLWHELSDEERQKFSAEYIDEKHEFAAKATENVEVASATRPKRVPRKKGVSGPLKSKLLVDLYDKPRKPPTAYLLFVQARLEAEYRMTDQHEGNPSLSTPQPRDLMKTIAEEWKRLNESQKKSFQETATKLSLEYKSNLKLWEDEQAKLGRWYLLSRSKQMDLTPSGDDPIKFDH